MITSPATPATLDGARPTRDRRLGHGRRLIDAFEALESLPASTESLDRLLALLDRDDVSTGDVVSAIESDVALTVSVLRYANQADTSEGPVASVVDALALLSPHAVEDIARYSRTFDVLELPTAGPPDDERFRLHAVATQRAAERIANAVDHRHPDRLAVAALLHDVGKLVLTRAYPVYPEGIHRGARTPEERVHLERRELGADHALVGGVLARRWGLPNSVVSAIERHHAEDADGDAAIIRLADMLAHYENDDDVSRLELLRVARTIGLDPSALRAVMYGLSATPSSPRARQTSPCPLSAREMDVLTALSHGKDYQDIAIALSLSTHTIRSHLHNIYKKLGVRNRTQAVLLASDNDWLAPQSQHAS